MKLNFIHSTHQTTTIPVILLHGLFGSLSNLANTAKALSNDFSTYQLDLRNHGKSPHSATMTYTEMADDIIELMDNQGIQQAHIIGHSMGGKVAMQLALNHAHRVNKLIVADIAPVTYSHQHDAVLDGLQFLSTTKLTSRQQADELLASYVKHAPVRAFLLKNLARTDSGDYQLRLNVSAIVSNYASVASAPSGNPFIGPTLFIKGSESAYIQNKHKDEILHLFPAAQIKIISGVGHWLHSDKPDTFNRLVQQFLNN